MSKYTKIFLFLLFTVVICNWWTEAQASNGSAWYMPSIFFGAGACAAYNCFFGSDVIVIISSLGIFVLGIMTLTGKIQWITSITLILGIILLSGAAEFVNSINSLPTNTEEIGSATVFGVGCDTLASSKFKC